MTSRRMALSRVLSWSRFAILYGTALEDAARDVGMVFEEREPRPYFWDGKTCATRSAGGGQRSNIDLWHDLAHFQICPQRRIDLPEFGLGGFAWVNRDLKRTLTKRRSDDEEGRAFVLGYTHFHRWLPASADLQLDGLFGGWQGMIDACPREVDWLLERGLLTVIGRGRLRATTVVCR